MQTRNSHQSGQQQEEAYPVERIVSKRVSPDTGEWEYRIRWVGYGPDEDTWEPVKQLVGAYGLWVGLSSCEYRPLVFRRVVPLPSSSRPAC